MNIIKDGKFYRACCEKGDISDIYSKFTKIFEKRGILIVTLDSNNVLFSICSLLNEKDIACKMVGSYCYIFPASVPQLFREGKTFCHFDEIYLMDKIPSLDEIPRDYFPPLTDDMLFDQKNIPNWGKTMQKLGASYFFSDGGSGFGINIGGKDFNTIKEILKEFGEKK